MARSAAEDRSARRVYHLSHCIMRMKHRYDLDLDAEGYDDLCTRFAKGEALGVREDDKRNREGWLKFKDTWVCVSYIPSMKLIGTIMPSPPPLVLEALPAQAKKIEAHQYHQRFNEEQIRKCAFAMFNDAMNARKFPKWLQGMVPEAQRDDWLNLSEEVRQQHINEMVAIQAKKIAYTLFDQAMNAGKAPKWLQKQIMTDEGAVVPETIQQHAEDYIARKEHGRVTADPKLKKADLAWFKLKIQVAREQLKEGRFLDAAVTLDAVSSLPATFHPSLYPEEAEKLLEYRDSIQRGWMEEYFKAQGIPESVDIKGP